MSHKWLVLSFWVFILIGFLTLPFGALQTDDASMYALAVKNMVLHNTWLTPLITPGDVHSFLDKPPLGLWLLAVFPRLLGVSELSLHLGNVFFFLLALAAMAFFMLRFSNPVTTFKTMLIAATSLAAVVYTRSPKMEILLMLFIILAHLFLGLFLQKEKNRYVFGFFICLALGFLVKSGLALILPFFTVILIVASDHHNRQTLVSLLQSRFLYLAAATAACLVLAVLGIQALAFKGLWLEYIKSFTLVSKYNTGYLGLGFYPAALAFGLLAIFPWTPLVFSKLQIQNRPDLRNFCANWFWGSLVFFLFFYRQVDFRTVVVLVPPMAMLAGLHLQQLSQTPRREPWLVAGSVILAVLLAAAIPGLFQSHSPALGVACLLFLTLVLLAVYFWKTKEWKLTAVFVVLCLAYTSLFLNVRPLVEAANPQAHWPQIIREYRNKGYQFYIYRPHNRPLFMSNDLAWLDFVAGPADRYIWETQKIISNLNQSQVLLLTDAQSYRMLGLKTGQVLLEDKHGVLYKFN